jgi:hypothetical protein
MYESCLPLGRDAVGGLRYTVHGTYSRTLFHFHTFTSPGIHPVLQHYYSYPSRYIQYPPAMRAPRAACAIHTSYVSADVDRFA